MSALHPIATAKAKFQRRSCPLYPRKRTCAVQLGMAAKGNADNASLFDHLVCACEQRWRNCEVQRFRGLKVDHQLVLGRRLHRKVSGLFAFEDAIDVAATSI